MTTRIVDQICAMPWLGINKDEAQLLAYDALKYFSAPLPHCRQKHTKNSLPRTVIRTHQFCTYILQTKGGINLLGRGANSKVCFALKISSDKSVSMVKAKIAYNNFETRIQTDKQALIFSSPFVESPSQLIFSYVSEKKNLPRTLFIGEYLAFDAESMNFQNLTTLQQLKILGHAAKGLAVLHQYNFIHNDIKADNLLIRWGDDDYQGVLGDFDLMRKEKMGGVIAVGSPLFISPEAYRIGSLTKPKDSWAFGLLLYYLFSKERTLPSFINRREEDTNSTSVFAARLSTVTEDELLPEKLFPTGWSSFPNEDLEWLIRQCLSLKPEMRPSALFISSFIKKIYDDLIFYLTSD